MKGSLRSLPTNYGWRCARRINNVFREASPRDLALVRRCAAKRLVLPVGIEPTTSPLPRANAGVKKWLSFNTLPALFPMRVKIRAIMDAGRYLVLIKLCMVFKGLRRFVGEQPEPADRLVLPARQ